MPPFNLAAPIAATILACAPAVAWADIPCPSNDPRQPDSPRYPTFTSYTVTRSTAPASERTSGSHDVTVIGGDAVEGNMRVDITLSSDLPRDCPLSVMILDPSVSPAQQRDGAGDTAKVFRIEQSDAIQTMAARRTYFDSVRLSGDGTNRLVMHLKTRGQYGDHTARLAFVIPQATGDPTYPFTITRRGLPDVAMTLSEPRTRFGSTVTVFAALPFTPGPEAIDQTVTYSVKPPAAGGFRRPNQLASLAPSVTVPLDDDVTPRRAMAIFVPAATDKPITASIMATLMGRTKTTPITILPVPKPCKPVPEWSVGKGVVELTLTNTGELPCPDLHVTLSAANVTIGGSYARSSPIFPSPAPPASPAAPAIAAASRSLIRAAPPPANPREPISWTGSFQIAAPYPASGFAVTATLRPSDGSFPTITLPPFTVDRLNISKSR